MVEAALVFPILIMIIMAMLELGMAFKDYLSVSYLSREGTRIAGLAGADPMADCAVLVGIAGLATPGDLERIQAVQIYRAEEATGNQIMTDTNYGTRIVGNDPTVCSVPNDPDIDGWLITESWAPTSRRTAVGSTPLDIVGVRVILERGWITGFPPFRGPPWLIDESTITRLEPTVFE